MIDLQSIVMQYRIKSDTGKKDPHPGAWRRDRHRGRRGSVQIFGAGREINEIYRALNTG
jgi:hypothetical protein